MKTTVLLTAFLVGCASVTAQNLPQAARAAADRITAQQIAQDLNYLSSNALRGRDTFSPGYDTAAHYIAERLKRAGLEPFGDDGSYFQYYTVVSQSFDTARAYIEIDGKRLSYGDILVQLGEQLPLAVTTQLIYVDHGMRIPSLGVDPYAGHDIRGKVLLVRQGARPAELPQGSAAPPDAEGYTRVARSGGAIAIISIASPNTLQYWDEGRRAAFPFRDLQPNVPSAYSRAGALPTIYVRPGAIDTTYAGPVTINVPLRGRELLRTYNVIARIRGADPQLRDEYITIAAHLDGAVGTIAFNGDSIYNAADDNASGSAGLLAIAEQMARLPKPKRSIVFIWDSGEEVGLYGTRSFVDRKIVDPKNIVAHVNVDMIGATRASGAADSASADVTERNEVYLIGPRVLSASMDTLIQRVNRGYLGMRLNPRYDEPGESFFYPRTDAGPFLERGVLTVGFFTGLHPRYHMPQDEARYLDPEKIAAVSKTVLAVVHAIANADVAPTIDKAIPARVPRYP